MGALTSRGVSDRRTRRPRPEPGAPFYRRCPLPHLRAIVPAAGAARAAFCVFAVVLAFAPAAAPAGAQETDTVRLGTPDSILPPMVEPAPADTFVLTDSILEPSDTVTGADTLAADSAEAPTHGLLALPRPHEAGFAEGVGVWDRAALLRSPALSVADLLERMAGLNRVRAGYYTQPEMVVSPASLSGDVEVLIDGFPLDPLTGTTFDLSRIAVTDLEALRVERRGGRLRIELTMLDLVPPRGSLESSPERGAYTRVQVATGDLDTDGLAGAFAAPRFLIGPVVIAASRLNSDGFARTQPGRSSSAWLRWGMLRERWGVHAEYRRATMEREEGSILPGETRREDAILRARVRPLEFLSAELYAGHSEEDDLFIDDSVTTELATTHWGVRSAYDRGWVGTQAALRFRNGDGGPSRAAELIGDLRPLPWIGLSAEVRHESWEDDAFRTLSAGGRVGPWLGARLFAEWSDGEHGLAWLTREDGTPSVQRTRLRAGIDWQLGGWRVGAAALRAEGDSVAPPVIPGVGPFGSRLLSLYPGFELTGVEATFRIPIVYEPFGLEGAYTRLSAGSDGFLSIFQATEQARAALVYHDAPLDGGQLEVMARLEAEFRGETRVPSATEVGTVVVLGPTQRLDFELSIRVLDVHAFVHWQNILHRQRLQDLPGLTLPGQTAYFGVKWELWN